jgi:hypothetical protein
MSISGLLYFLENYFGNKYSGIFDFYLGFTGNSVSDISPNSGTYAENFTQLGDFSDFYSYPDSGFFDGGQKVSFSFDSPYQNSTSEIASLFFVYEKSGIGNGVIFSNISSGVGGDVCSGFSIGLTKANKLFFEYYDNYIKKPVSFSFPEIIGDKNLVNLNIGQNSCSINVFDKNLDETFFNSSYFYYPGGPPEHSSNCFLGGVSDISPAFCEKSNFTGWLDSVGLSREPFSEGVFSCFCSGFFHDVDYFENSEQIEIEQVTGYEEGGVLLYSGVTGYETVFSDEIEDDFGNVYSGFQTTELSGEIYGTGLIPLVGIVIVDAPTTSGFQVGINTGKFDSIGFNGANSLIGYDQEDVYSIVSSSGGTFSEEIEDDFFFSLSNQELQFDRVKRKFVVDRDYLKTDGDVLLYINGVFQKSGTVTGNKFAGFEISSGDFFSSGGFIYSSGLYSEFDKCMADYLNSGFLSLNILENFSHISGTGTRFFASIDYQSNNSVYFNGQKLNLDIDFTGFAGNYLFLNSYSLFDGATGDLIIVSKKQGTAEKNSIGAFVSLDRKISERKCEFYLNGVRQELGEEFVLTSKYDFLTGKSSKNNYNSVLFNNDERFFV